MSAITDNILAQQHRIAGLSARVVAIRDKIIGAPALPPLSAPGSMATPTYSGFLGDLEGATIDASAQLNAAIAAIDELEKAFG